MKHILIPELVPLANKGEEAIVRGISDVLFPDGNCELHLFDEVDEYRFEDGIHVYPVSWFISPWLHREFGLGYSWEKIRDSACSLLRNGLHKLRPGWVKTHCRALAVTGQELTRLARGDQPGSERQRRLRALLDVDYIVAGHDGALDERVCHVIDVFRDFGKRFGVFGVELPSSFKSADIVGVADHTLAHAEFFFCRTRASWAVVESHFPKVSARVLPDPAFGMRPSPPEQIESLKSEHNLRKFFERPVLMCTSCEPPPISRFCFETIPGPQAKLNAHRELFARLIEHVVAKHDVNVLFLPHAIGPGSALDDRLIASDIIRRSAVPAGRVRVLDVALPARDLKGLIGEAEFMIAERIHSMIGAVGVGTPFLCLGSRTDRRIHGIVREMIGVDENVYYLNAPSFETLANTFDRAWEGRSGMRRHLTERHASFQRELEAAATVMRSRMSAHEAP